MGFYRQLYRYNGRTAVVTEDGKRFTYERLHALCVETGEKLEPGKLSFLLCENSIGAVVMYLSHLYRGTVPLLLDKNIDRGLLGKLCETYEPEYICIPEDMPENGKYRELCNISYGMLGRNGYVLYRTKYCHEEKLPKELALLLSTSGSTGSSKLVRQSGRNIDSNANTIASYLELTQEDKAITTLPMHYTYGLSVINSSLSVGACILLTKRSVTENEFWKFFRQEGATTVNGVPYTYEILDKIRFWRMELPSLQSIICGGGKLSLKLHEKLAGYAAETGRRFYIRYGQTESTANMAYLPYERAAEKIGSIGIAIPGGEFCLWDENKEEIHEPERQGELIYRGPNVTLGYAKSRGDLLKEDEWNGLLETGDMAYRDRDGFYYISGRKKRFLKIYGNRVNLDETERLIRARFQGIECACVGKDDRMYIYTAGADEGIQQEMMSYIKQTLHLYHGAFEIREVAEIPKSAAGKTLYYQLQ